MVFSGALGSFLGLWDHSWNFGIIPGTPESFQGLWDHSWGSGIIPGALRSFPVLWNHSWGSEIIPGALGSFLRLWDHSWGSGIIPGALGSFPGLWDHSWGSGIIPAPMDVPALLSPIERFCFSAGQVLFCAISPGAHHCCCTRRGILLSWAPVFIVKWNFISHFISLRFSAMRASCSSQRSAVILINLNNFASDLCEHHKRQSVFVGSKKQSVN